MKLFEIVPANFFSILVSPNREIYVDALMILHEEFKEKLNIKVEDYLSSLIFLLEDRQFELESDDEPQGALSVSGKARLIMERLTRTGWIEREFIENSFIEIISLQPYAVPVIKLLSELGSEESEEYSSMVFATFSGLKQAMEADQEHLYEAVQSARANTERLQHSMRKLYHGIRRFLRGIVQVQDVNALLTEHFMEFRRLSDRYYHPIKTLDSVYRYMGPIQELIASISREEQFVEAMVARAMSLRQLDSEEAARQEVLTALDYVAGSFSGMDRLINEIDRKNSSYTKSSVEKIRYLMTADQSIRGKLAQILKTVAAADGSEQDRVLDRLERGIQASRQESLDASSIYHKTIRARRVVRPALPVDTEDPLSGMAQAFLLDQMKTAYPVARIRRFVEDLFEKAGPMIRAADLPLESDEEFILLILAVIRHQDPRMPYTIVPGEGRILRNGYWIPDLTIQQKTQDPKIRLPQSELEVSDPWRDGRSNASQRKKSGIRSQRTKSGTGQSQSNAINRSNDQISGFDLIEAMNKESDHEVE